MYYSNSLMIPSIPPSSSPPTTSRSLLSRCRKYLRNLRPETLVLLPLPYITIILICLLILLFDILLEVTGDKDPLSWTWLRPRSRT